VPDFVFSWLPRVFQTKGERQVDSIGGYPKSEIESLKRTQLEPSFGLFHQQGLDPRASFKPRADHFQSYDKHRLLPVPVVLSVDPGQSGGINASRSAIQAWKHYDGRFYLIDQFCDHCDFERLRVKFWWFAAHYRASVVLIEKTANGPALYSHIKTRQVLFEIKMIRPTDPKGIRLARHFGKIGHKRIYLPEDAIWREPFIDEIIHFPGEYDDQVDAMTQYFDYMDTKPVIPMPRPREIAFGIAFGSQNSR
jgi:predicted phage terminase large subunit-like protein